MRGRDRRGCRGQETRSPGEAQLAKGGLAPVLAHGSFAAPRKLVDQMAVRGRQPAHPGLRPGRSCSALAEALGCHPRKGSLAEAATLTCAARDSATGAARSAVTHAAPLAPPEAARDVATAAAAPAAGLADAAVADLAAGMFGQTELEGEPAALLQALPAPTPGWPGPPQSSRLHRNLGATTLAASPSRRERVHKPWAAKLDPALSWPEQGGLPRGTSQATWRVGDGGVSNPRGARRAPSACLLGRRARPGPRPS
mmetsp:Transcript_34078/g.72481  ORF Transcript_34078/g.72481 Transcript_34078/m.72481 type:complete len:255 (-) Transcript_34078:1483-2247(-)